MMCIFYSLNIHGFPAGLELLLGLLSSGNQKQKHDGSVALHKLAAKVFLVSPVDPTPL